MSSIIFLDFDGVLNSREHLSSVDRVNLPSDEEWSLAKRILGPQSTRYQRSGLVNDLRMLNRKMVQRVQRLVDLTAAEVVVSSFWRISRSIEALESILRFHGWTKELLDVTPTTNFEDHTTRGDEIKAWLDLHPSVGSICILDDDPNMGPLAQYHVMTDFKFGFTEQDLEKALRLLNPS